MKGRRRRSPSPEGMRAVASYARTVLDDVEADLAGVNVPPELREHLDASRKALDDLDASLVQAEIEREVGP